MARPPKILLTLTATPAALVLLAELVYFGCLAGPATPLAGYFLAMVGSAVVIAAWVTLMELLWKGRR